MEEHRVLVIPYASQREPFVDAPIKLTGQRRIAEFSVAADRQIHLDSRENARILIDKRVNESMKIDLKKGIESFLRQELEEEACLNILLKWACMQEGDSVKEIFDHAEIVGWQGTFRRIATSLFSNDSMGIVVIRVDGVIFLSETQQKYGEQDSRWEEEEPFYLGYSKFKQRHVLTTSSDGRIDHKKPIDNRQSFEVIVRSELVNESTDESISLFVGSSVEALTKEGEAVEFMSIHKDASFWKKNRKDGNILRNANSLLRCHLTDLKWIIFGARNDEFMLTKTKTRGREEFE
ncbi:hypothetical protein PMAYCL1PPCAC_25331, partial [Pristionchus mayeri]